MPVSFSNGISWDTRDEVVSGGPASSGVRNAFSQEPDLFSEGLVEASVGEAVVCTLSTFNSWTCASRSRFRFIRFSSICNALSNRMPGFSPRWNLKAIMIDSAAMITRTDMSMVEKES